MAVNIGNVFSAVHLSECMVRSLPRPEQPSPPSSNTASSSSSQSESEEPPQLRTAHDAIAFLAHACMIAVGFRLVGLGENHKIEAAADRNHLTPLPLEWNRSTSGDYAFRYAHDQSSLEYLVKISRLGPKVVINGLGVGDDKVHMTDLLVRDYISESSLPYKFKAAAANVEENAQALRQIFISAGRLTDAGSLIKLQIIQKLAPGLRKEGYEESADSTSPSCGSSNQRAGSMSNRESMNRNEPDTANRPYPVSPASYQDPFTREPQRPFPAGELVPPGFDDEYDILRRPSGGNLRMTQPVNIGERDLYPQGLGPNDPLNGRGGFGIGGHGGGGMHPSFQDPLFGGRGSGQIGPYDPRAPPGARYDPTGLGDMDRSHLGGGVPFRGGPPNPFGGYGSNDFI